jgi:hypothetical protein
VVRAHPGATDDLLFASVVVVVSWWSQPALHAISWPLVDQPHQQPNTSPSKSTNCWPATKATMHQGGKATNITDRQNTPDMTSRGQQSS